MSNVRCIETKGYNLTIEKEYEIIRDDREFFFVENDNGKTARYAKSLFREVRATPPAPVRTERTMIDSISWNNNRTISYVDLQGNTQSFTSPFSFNGSSISCGVNQCSNVDELIDRVNDSVDNIDGDDDYVNLRKALIIRVINEDVKGRRDVSMTTMSTTTSDEDMIAAIDSVADVTSAVRRNPNSRNLIKMWVFYTAANPN